MVVLSASRGRQVWNVGDYCNFHNHSLELLALYGTQMDMAVFDQKRTFPFLAEFRPESADSLFDQNKNVYR
jgi:hypothetical protein